MKDQTEVQAAVELIKSTLNDEYEAGEPRSRYDTAMETIVKALYAAQKEIAELKRDSEIVEWMEKDKPTALCLCIFDNDKLVGHRWEINSQHEAQTFREAATAAMTQNK